tara:strand:+ start:564 stop:782 length:219 start_codon:yes stop_codon:yes gene_type:complete
MLTIYILLILAFITLCKNFHSIFYKDAEFAPKKSNYILDLYVEPIVRGFNAFKYRNLNKIYDIKDDGHEMCS